MNRFEKAAEFGAMMGKLAFYKRAADPALDSYRKQQEQATIARIKAQAAAVRNAAGVTGPGGGTSSGTVFPDGKGGYRVEGAKFTPQAGYNQQGFKVQPGVAQPAQTAPAAEQRYSLRDDPEIKDFFNETAEEKVNVKRLQEATGGAGSGTYQGTMQGGKVQPGATFTPTGGQQGQRPLPRASNPSLDFYKKQMEDRLADARAQTAAIRRAAGVTGPGGGTATGKVFPDGKGGYRVEGAKFTPQAGYNQQGFKVQPGVAQPAPAPKAAPANKTIPSKRVILPD